ncbi:MAG: VOC family protein [Acidimicrobiia bacterium]|nr:VOC family protein [Acidimicrobiia bacterium]
MESLIASMLKKYETGTVSRRDLIAGLAALTASLAARPAAAQSGFEVIGIDHIQINARHAERSAHFYRDVFGLIPIRAGAMTDESEEIAHMGTPGNLLISFRKFEPYGIVDHIGLRVAPGVSGEDLRKAVEARGGKFNPPDPTKPPGSYVHDLDGLRVQIGTKVATKPY